MIRANKNPLPGYFGTISPEEMEKITTRYNEISGLAEKIQRTNKEGRRDNEKR